LHYFFLFWSNSNSKQHINPNNKPNNTTKQNRHHFLGAAIKIVSQREVFIIENNKKRLVPNQNMLFSLGYDFDHIFEISGEEGFALMDGKPF